MSVSETFDRKFNKCMRGYNPEEVDSAVDALLRYCDDLEAANREFEIANNDLIDEKNELAKKLDDSENDQNALRSELQTMSENLTRIEGIYNDYRAKFGEARDLVINAKNAASEIMEKASESASALIKDAERRSEEEKSKLATEIAYRKKLTEELETAYDDFKTRIAAELGKMLAEISDFSLKPDIPEIPDDVLRGAISAVPPPSIDAVRSADHISESTTEEPQNSAEPENCETAPSEQEQDDPTVQNKQANDTEQKKDQAETGRFYADINNIWRDNLSATDDEKKPSPLDEIKSSVEKINTKVIEKKSTPHI